MTIEIIKVPDIGSDSAEVTEILVAVGDELQEDQSLVVMESDKASLEVPCPKAGKVSAIKVAVGDQLSEGMDLIELEVASDAAEVEVSQEAEPEAAESASAQVEPVQQAAESVSTENLYHVPDIGSDEAEVIELAVSVGDELSEGDSVVVAESDKASLEIPAEASGTVVALHVSEGDKIQQGADLITIRTLSTSAQAASSAVSEQPQEQTVEAAPAKQQQAAASSGPVDLFVPDMGSDAAAEIIEIPVAVGDKVEEGDTLVVVETDKASVEVPAEAAGEITALHVEEGMAISQGDKLATLKSEAGTVVEAKPAAGDAPVEAIAPEVKAPTPAPAKTAVAETSPAKASSTVHAGPAVRKLARQLGVDLGKVKATGQRGRVLKEDVHTYVKQQLQAPKSGAASGAGIPEIPAVDWGQFGDIDVQAMSRINKVTATNMSRNWLNVPHVTQFDDADVTELEKYRGFLKPEGVARGIKMTPLAFLLRASAVALKENPKFNTALHENGEDLVERRFFHISIAVDTPLGLMVPVIRDVDQKDIWQLADEVATLAAKAKNGKLSPKEMQGASFTISSLGAIGGTGFTPIVPAPQVGILGVSKTSIQPVWDGHSFVPRNRMPLALSYDHRVVNGADAGRFMSCLVDVLGDLNRIWND